MVVTSSGFAEEETDVAGVVLVVKNDTMVGAVRMWRSGRRG